jgi:hypothetical protein
MGKEIGMGVFWTTVAVFGIFYILRMVIEGIPIDGKAIITTLVWAVLISGVSSLIKKLRKRDNGQIADDRE